MRRVVLVEEEEFYPDLCLTPTADANASNAVELPKELLDEYDRAADAFAAVYWRLEVAIAQARGPQRQRALEEWRQKIALDPPVDGVVASLDERVARAAVGRRG